MEIFDITHFDTVYNRRIDGDIKYRPVPGIDDVIPMWIADMDFEVPPAVKEALHATVQHGIFGYTETDREYDTIIAEWYKRRINWEIKPEWILKTFSVMFSIATAISALTDSDDGILICQPVYHPFAKIIPANHRKLVVSHLRLRDGRYEIDFEDFEKKIQSEHVKAFLLCSPHNPVGRVWTKEELFEIGRICVKHHVYIISDEIHSDFIYPGHNHVPIAVLSEEIAEITVTCTAPTKTFNLAGIQTANIIISNPQLRKKVQKESYATGYGEPNLMAVAATKAAYKYGEPWLDALLVYLQENVRTLRDFCLSTGGKISLIEPDGTYLTWLDCRGLGLTDPELKTFFKEKSRVWLHNGTTFGAGGSGFARMNIACPKSVLETALDRVAQELGQL